jgi:hypothetical protein
MLTPDPISLVLDLALAGCAAYLLHSRRWWRGYSKYLERRCAAADAALFAVISGQARLSVFRAEASAAPVTDCPRCRQDARDQVELARSQRCRPLEDIPCPECGRSRTILVPDE